MSDKPTQITLRNPLTRFLFAAVCGVGAVGLLYVQQEQTLTERSGGQRVQVLIAKADTQAKARLDTQNIGLQEVPRAYVHPDAIPAAERDKIAGRKLYRGVRQNQPLQWGDFDPPESEHNIAVPRGQRATILALGEALGKSRLLSPGDYVDILVHFNFQDLGSVTTTLMQRVQVLELIGSSAMVALTPEQAEQLVFARANGTVTLALRAREDIERRELVHMNLPRLLESLNLSNLQPAPDAAAAQPANKRKAGSHEDAPHTHGSSRNR